MPDFVLEGIEVVPFLLAEDVIDIPVVPLPVVEVFGSGVEVPLFVLNILELELEI